jgi:hypothetical protein
MRRFVELFVSILAVPDDREPHRGFWRRRDLSKAIRVRADGVLGRVC